MLRDKDTKEEVKVGDWRTTFRGERVQITWIHPDKNKVCCRAEGKSFGQEYYPSVVGCEFTDLARRLGHAV